MRSSLRQAAALWAALAILGGAVCAAGTAPAVEIRDAWIRWLPASLPAGGYAILHNAGDQPAILRAVSSPDYLQASLHRTSMRDGNSSMQPVTQIAIPAHTDLNFAAAGYHIMLRQPTRPLQPGDHVSITLHFADGSSMSVRFEVRRPDADAHTP